jgi:hypothetical protein
MFFGPGLAKTSVFTQFSACYKKYVFHAKGTKHCKLQCFGSALRVRGGGGGGGSPQININCLNNQVPGLASLPFKLKLAPLELPFVQKTYLNRLKKNNCRKLHPKGFKKSKF